jgi:putative toxin-antitoxin system antitoxin component (TIGR02293 family)
MNTLTIDRRTIKILDKYKRQADNSISLMLYSRKGLKPDAVFDFITVSGFPGVQVERLLNKSIKTFQNYKENNTTLDPTISEKLLKLFDLYNKGIMLFGTVEEFNKWLAEPAFGLGNQVPEDLLDTITGIQLTYEELIRIEFGDLA